MLGLHDEIIWRSKEVEFWTSRYNGVASFRLILLPIYIKYYHPPLPIKNREEALENRKARPSGMKIP